MAVAAISHPMSLAHLFTNGNEIEMVYSFKYNWGKYKNLWDIYIQSVANTLLLLLPVILCVIIIVYTQGIPLVKSVVSVCSIELILLLPFVIVDLLLHYRTVVYDLFFDGETLHIKYYKYFQKRHESISYDDLSFAVKTRYSYYLQGTCVQLYSRHKTVVAMVCRPGWDEPLMIEIIKVLMDIKKNKMELPLNQKLFSKDYFYTMGLERSGVAKKLIEISKTMDD